VGAGMGRAVLLATEMRFRRVIGVELHATLVRIARRNLTVWRRAGRAKAQARMVQADSAEFSFPPGPSVVFLFNPVGAVVMRRLLHALRLAYAARKGELDILYVNDEQRAVLEQARGFVRLYSGKVPRSCADAMADDRILNSQPDGEYASAPYEDCS